MPFTSGSEGAGTPAPVLLHGNSASLSFTLLDEVRGQRVALGLCGDLGLQDPAEKFFHLMCVSFVWGSAFTYRG